MLTSIDWLMLPGRDGRVGMMSCPGGGRYHTGDDHGVAADLQQMHSAGARCLVTLLPDDELGLLGVSHLGRLAAAHGIRWLQLPIEDMRAPGESFEIRWGRAGPLLHAELVAGRHVVLHCYAGLGRTGTIAARLLIETGVAPREAMTTVRAVRPGAIQSLVQERYVLALGGAGGAGASSAGRS